MCGAIAVARRTVPDAVYSAAGLEPRLVTRSAGSEPELQFSYRDKIPQLPVLWNGQLQIVSWGNRDDKASRLPRTGWARIESIESGKWAWLQPEPVDIPAVFGLEKGVWYQITEGMRGVIVRNEQRQPRVYMLTQPASHYYEVMTRHERMPVLIDQTI